MGTLYKTMQSILKNPLFSHSFKRVKCSNIHSSLSHIAYYQNTNTINAISISSFCSSIKEQQIKINGSDIDLNKPLPNKPEWMDEDFDSTQELEVMGLYDTEITKKQAPDSRIFNAEYDPDYDPMEEDQIEVGGKKEKPQHRIIKSNVKEDVVIEMEAISNMERLYSWIVVFMSCYCGMLAVRFYFMRDALKKQREEIKQEKLLKNKQSVETLT